MITRFTPERRASWWGCLNQTFFSVPFAAPKAWAAHRREVGVAWLNLSPLLNVSCSQWIYDAPPGVKIWRLDRNTSARPRENVCLPRSVRVISRRD